MTADPWAEWRAKQTPIPVTVGRKANREPASFWQREARKVVQRVMAELAPNATRKDAERALREAYPFGEREYWPYQMWLRERKAALVARFGIASTTPLRCTDPECGHTWAWHKSGGCRGWHADPAGRRDCDCSGWRPA